MTGHRIDIRSPRSGSRRRENRSGDSGRLRLQLGHAHV
jgi:hypothetical protein